MRKQPKETRRKHSKPPIKGEVRCNVRVRANKREAQSTVARFAVLVGARVKGEAHLVRLPESFRVNGRGKSEAEARRDAQKQVRSFLKRLSYELFPVGSEAEA